AMNNYRTLADWIADDIVAGRLPPGERLLPQREFAYQNRIAPSTAGRVYAELLHRGLVIGEVGRGTFVAAQTARTGVVFSEPTTPWVDLEHIFPVLPDQEIAIARSLSSMLQPEAVAGVLNPVPAAGAAPRTPTPPHSPNPPGRAPRPPHFPFTGHRKHANSAAHPTPLFPC